MTELVGEGGGNVDVVDSLLFEEVSPTFYNDRIEFKTDTYLDISIDPKQLFVPDELIDQAILGTYNLQEWHGDKARVQYQLEYGTVGTGAEYPTEDLKALLGWDHNADSDYPDTFFQTPVRETDILISDERAEDVFVFDISADFSGYKVYWEIVCHSNYEVLVIDYKLYYQEDGEEPELIVVKDGPFIPEDAYTFRNVYYGDEPDYIPMDISINKYRHPKTDTYIDRLRFSVDNRYKIDRDVTVTIAYPKEKDIYTLQDGTELLNLPGDYVEIDYVYDQIKANANSLGATGSLLENEDDFTIRSFEVTIPEDKLQTMSYAVPSPKGEKNKLYVWLEG